MVGVDFGLGHFGDLRLEKGGRICMRLLLVGLARASANWRNAIERVRSSSRAFCVMAR